MTPRKVIVKDNTRELIMKDVKLFPDQKGSKEKTGTIVVLILLISGTAHVSELLTNVCREIRKKVFRNGRGH